MLDIRRRLSAIARRDAHAKEGKYHIRSLYFDTPEDTALREKLLGVAKREKYRIRCYDGDTSFIRLEKKTKIGGMGTKDMAALTPGQVMKIIEGDTDWLIDEEDELLRQFYAAIRNERLLAKTVVDYTREPFIYDPGNVRVTLDYDIRSGLKLLDMLDFTAPTIPVKESPIILEVKWDNFLPEVIRQAVQLPVREQAYSKYAACRMYD
ncbi:MAG: polyphosphate polymerase domain-containing protein [Lachnospiraceae bacterium]|nr:polyphosphate polymerase domain-containing protein [Lachnospiraceae bacterium]